MASDGGLPLQCEQTRDVADEAWMLAQCFKIMMMQAGFAVVESSFVRQKNSANIMMKNAVDLALGAILYWAFGYALAYGVDPSDPDNVNPFVGTGNFFLIDMHDPASWMFQLSFAATAATIDSGAVAERMQFVPYIIYSGLMTSVFYPVVCHWCWDSNGWLAKMDFHDFAGSCVVHLVGGASALAAAWFVGPRIGRFADKGELVVTVVSGVEVPLPTVGGQKATDSMPFVVVKQLNHGNGELETRTAHSSSAPRWGTNLKFDVALDDEDNAQGGGKKVKPEPKMKGGVGVNWTTVDDWMNHRASQELSPHGDGSRHDMPPEGGRSPSMDLSRWANGSSGGRGSPRNRNATVFEQRFLMLYKDHFEAFTSEGGSRESKVMYTMVEKVEDWGKSNILIHLVDLRVLEMSFPTFELRDQWLFKILECWRMRVSPQMLSIQVIDEMSDTLIGQGRMTIYAVDSSDPEKFKIKTFVSLNTGGKIEIDAQYTSPQRMTREIFQACDPNKLLFGTFLLWVNWYFAWCMPSLFCLLFDFE